MMIMMIMIMTTVTSAQVSMLLETVHNDDNDDNDNDQNILFAGVHAAGDCAAHPSGVLAAPDHGHGESQPNTELHLQVINIDQSESCMFTGIFEPHL